MHATKFPANVVMARRPRRRRGVRCPAASSTGWESEDGSGSREDDECGGALIYCTFRGFCRNLLTVKWRANASNYIKTIDSLPFHQWSLRLVRSVTQGSRHYHAHHFKPHLASRTRDLQ